MQSTKNADCKLDSKIPVKIIVRPDIENRNFHHVTKAYAGLEQEFPEAIRPEEKGFAFSPPEKPAFKMSAAKGKFVVEPEWQYMIHLSEEAERGLEDCTDLFSPGYFSFGLVDGENVEISAETIDETVKTDKTDAGCKNKLKAAINQFIVKRDDSLTVIAGYPWFLDWGRDTLIALRGIISAGFISEDCNGRTVEKVLESIIENYINGTPNGIKMDKESGLVFSPSHFTWMDTNHPAGTPREGYPIEIQSLWFFALDFYFKISGDKKYKKLSEKVSDSISELFTKNPNGCLSDCLYAGPGIPAENAAPDDAIRSNQLFAITLGAVKNKRLCEKIITTSEQLLIPGAIRSLANLPVTYPLPVLRDGELLNDPMNPYFGKYTGDEDTRRKAAYHNGTAWTWPFPSFAEALLTTYGNKAVKTAKSILLSSEIILEDGCVLQIPEIIDGNLPHTLKGCGAQAWGVTELSKR